MTYRFTNPNTEEWAISDDEIIIVADNKDDV